MHEGHVQPQVGQPREGHAARQRRQRLAVCHRQAQAAAGALDLRGGVIGGSVTSVCCEYVLLGAGTDKQLAIAARR